MTPPWPPFSWPEFDALLATTPARTGSVITTIYGDAILPRGGSLALADLLTLMHRLGASDGLVRTAVSRLAADGVLQGRRIGRSSAYALTDPSRAEFHAATPAIYGPLDRQTPHTLTLAFPDDPASRSHLDRSGFAPLTPTVLLGLDPAPTHVTPPITSVQATGPLASLRDLVARAWPPENLARDFTTLHASLAPLDHRPPPTPLDAMAARTLLIHAYRRLALKTPRLPAELRAPDWPGHPARARCIALYTSWAAASETWLDTTKNGPGPLPKGPDPLQRFS